MLITVLAPVRLLAHWWVMRMYVIERNRNRLGHRFYSREITRRERRIEELAGRLLQWTGDYPPDRR